MNQYLMTYYRGRDRDDWRDNIILANTLDIALEHAVDWCPDGWTIKKVELLNNQ